jgi:hypothetical protein
MDLTSHRRSTAAVEHVLARPGNRDGPGRIRAADPPA